MFIIRVNDKKMLLYADYKFVFGCKNIKMPIFLVV